MVPIGLSMRWSFMWNKASVVLMSQSPSGFRCGEDSAMEVSVKVIKVSIPIGLSMQWSCGMLNYGVAQQMSQSPSGFRRGGVHAVQMSPAAMALSQSPSGFRCGGVPDGFHRADGKVSIPIGLSMRWSGRTDGCVLLLQSQFPFGFRCGGAPCVLDEDPHRVSIPIGLSKRRSWRTWPTGT